MFDTVIVEGLKLKVPSEVKEFLGENDGTFPTDFQTKDLENCLLTYRIKESGQVYETHYIPTGKKVKSSLDFSNFRSNNSFLERLYLNSKIPISGPRMIDERKETIKKSKITETIAIYTYEEIGGRFLELEYELDIVNGKVKKHKLLKWEIESEEKSIERHTQDQKWKEEREVERLKHERFTQNWYYPILKEIYNPLVFFGSKAIVYICNKIIRLTYRWHRI